jgi:hypothetical protein
MKRKINLFLKNNFEDLLFFAGLLSILYGSYQINPLAAWFVAGAECLIAGFLIAWSKRK